MVRSVFYHQCRCTDVIHLIDRAPRLVVSDAHSGCRRISNDEHSSLQRSSNMHRFRLCLTATTLLGLCVLRCSVCHHIQDGIG